LSRPPCDTYNRPRIGWSGWRSGPYGGCSAFQARRRTDACVDATGGVVTWWLRVQVIDKVVRSWPQGHYQDARQGGTRVDQPDSIRRDDRRPGAARCAHQGGGRLVVCNAPQRAGRATVRLHGSARLGLGQRAARPTAQDHSQDGSRASVSAAGRRPDPACGADRRCDACTTTRA